MHLQVVERREDVPHVVALLQQRQVLRALVGKTAPELLEGLELVDELVHHVP